MYMQIFLLALVASFINCQGPFHGGTTSWTLYKKKWPIKEVFGSNWTSTVVNSENTWMVVMYASWCGPCQRFAPNYAAIAGALHGWRNVVKFAALACSHPDAEQICLDHGIVQYPTIKFFGPSSSDARGTKYNGTTSRPALEKSLVDFISKTKPIKSKSISFRPVLTIEEVQGEAVPGRHRKLLLFAENSTSSSSGCLGCYVILDASDQWKRVVVRRIATSGAVNMGITEFPSLHQVDANDGSLRLLASGLDRKGFSDVIHFDVLHIERGKLTSPVPGYFPATTSPATVILPDGVHEQDLESGIYYSLWREVALHPSLRARRLRAVKKHVNNMAKLLPVRAPIKCWLGKVNDWLRDQDNITNTEWKKALIDLRDSECYIPRRVIWTGCKGSQPAKRGYPCSLWTIFHTMTVAAHQHPEKGVSSKDVLLGMRDYIIKFFGCSDCVKHFTAISANVNSEVRGNDDGRSSVMWLWQTHNKVNKRLHGDITEDPAHPKMQFPTVTRCVDCHKDRPRDPYQTSEWYDSEVLDYLMSFYGESHVFSDSSPYTFIAPTVKGSKSSSDLVSGGLNHAPISLALLWFPLMVALYINP